MARTLPGECGSVNLAFSANTSVQSGDLLCGSTTVNPMIGDETPSDNFETTCFQVVNSYDPNEKLVSPYHTGDALSGGMIYEDEEVLTYTIHFQNLGTGPAYRVVVRDTLDANLLPESIKNVSFSHDGYLDVQGNVVSFVFDSIMLAPASQDWLASNGQIKFDINRTAGLPLGTEIKNNAAIYFDFNPAIITNETVSFIGRPDTATTSVEELDLVDLNMEVFPNPFKENFDLVYILEQNTSVSIHLYNTLGELVQTYQSETAVHSGEHSMNIQTNGLSAGLYMLRLETDYGSITKKLIKQ